MNDQIVVTSRQRLIAIVLLLMLSLVFAGGTLLLVGLDVAWLDPFDLVVGWVGIGIATLMILLVLALLVNMARAAIGRRRQRRARGY